MRLLMTFWLCQGALAAGLGCAAAPGSGRQTLPEAQKLFQAGCHSKARVEFAAALREAESGGADSRSVAMIFDFMGVNEEDSGNFRQAETLLNRGLSTIHPYAPHDPVLIDLEDHLAEVYLSEVRPEDAEAMLRHSLDALRRAARPEPRLIARADQDLALACMMQHRYDESAELLREGQVLLETQYGPDHPRLAGGLLAYAALLSAEHKYAEAVAPAERACQILRTACLPPNTTQLANASTSLASLYFRAGRTKEAAALASQAVDLAEEIEEPNHPTLALCLANYAYILQHTGHKREAKAFQKKAEEIARQAYPNGSGGDTINVAALRDGSH